MIPNMAAITWFQRVNFDKSTSVKSIEEIKEKLFEEWHERVVTMYQARQQGMVNKPFKEEENATISSRRDSPR